jgi:DNA-directed RNA polymerase specialized sigma24 family protein
MPREDVMATEGGDKGTVSGWIDDLKDPKRDKNSAAAGVWDRYYDALVRLAGGQLGAGYRAAADNEDFALSALTSLFRGAAAGCFPRVENREQLERLLATLVRRKVLRHVRNEDAKKRGGNRARADEGINMVADLSPAPEVVALAKDEVHRLFDLLADDSLREIAALKLEGYANAEIARRIGRNERTVERKLGLIRLTLEKELNHHE